MLKIMCFLTIIVLMLAANVSAVVYDDEGKVITEEEIKMEMNQVGKDQSQNGVSPGNCCCFLGTTSGAVLTGYSFLALYVFVINPDDWLSLSEESEGSDVEGLLFFAGGIIIGGYLGYKLSNKLGKLIDQKIAIKKIKEKRRNQKQNEEKSLIPETRMTLPLLTGSF